MPMLLLTDAIGIMKLISLTERRVMQSIKAIALTFLGETQPEMVEANDFVGGARLLGEAYMASND